MNEVTHSREFVAGVADEHTGFTNGAISNSHAFYELWSTWSHRLNLNTYKKQNNKEQKEKKKVER